MTRSPLKTAATTLYATLALLWLATPQSVSNWSRDYLPDFAQPIAAPLVNTIESIANTTRIPTLYEYARGFFQSATKKQN